MKIGESDGWSLRCDFYGHKFTPTFEVDGCFHYCQRCGISESLIKPQFNKPTHIVCGKCGYTWYDVNEVHTCPEVK